MSFLRTFRQLRKGLMAKKFHAQSLARTKSLTACGFPSREIQQISRPTALQWNKLGTSSGSILSDLSSTSHASRPPAHRLISSSRLRYHSQQCRSAAKQHLSMSPRCFSMMSATVRWWQSGLPHHIPIQHGNTGTIIARGFASQAQRSQQRRQLQKKSSEQGVYLVALVVGMVGLTYASVPLYRCAAIPFPGSHFFQYMLNPGIGLQFSAHKCRRRQHQEAGAQLSMTEHRRGCWVMHAIDQNGAGSESGKKEAPSTHCIVPCRIFCQATGFGGTVQEGRSVEDKLRAREERPDAAVEAAATAREIVVSFNADVADGMPWRFVPAQRSVKASLCMGFVKVLAVHAVLAHAQMPSCQGARASFLVCFWESACDMLC